MGTSGIDSTVASSQLEALRTNSQKSENTVSQLIGGGSNGTDRVNIDLTEVYKSLTVLAQNVLDKLQTILGEQLPNGIASLKPEEHTAEKTAQRIVDGSTAFFGVYAKQHPELEGEDLLNAFMKTIRGGIQTGYGQAESILGDIGAFDIDGVKSGIDETKKLVEEKLKAFEDNYRKQNGLVKTDASITEETKTEGTRTNTLA